MYSKVKPSPGVRPKRAFYTSPRMLATACVAKISTPAAFTSGPTATMISIHTAPNSRRLSLIAMQTFAELRANYSPNYQAQCASSASPYINCKITLKRNRLFGNLSSTVAIAFVAPAMRLICVSAVARFILPIPPARIMLRPKFRSAPYVI